MAGEVFRQLPAGGTKRPLENVGALAALRVRADAVVGRADLPGLSARAATANAAVKAVGDSAMARVPAASTTIALFTSEQFQALKPLLIVRDGGRFRPKRD